MILSKKYSSFVEMNFIFVKARKIIKLCFYISKDLFKDIANNFYFNSLKKVFKNSENYEDLFYTICDISDVLIYIKYVK